MRRQFLLAFAFAASVAQADPNVVPKLGSGAPIPMMRSQLFDDTYRIGDEWGKRKVTKDDIEAGGPLSVIARATGMLGGATSFYIGTYEGQHVLATNHHVCPTSCEGDTVNFSALGVKANVTKFYGTWTDIDLALMAIEFKSEGDAAKLREVGRPSETQAAIEPGQELITVGYGRGDNPFGKLVANQDSDCHVFSGRDDFRFMADPDKLNPGEYSVWSFSHGCDVSHGDSGSAMVERASGRIVGIVWTGKIPKSASVQDSSYLDKLLANGGEEIWTELSYAVPASKIAAILNEKIAQNEFDAETAKVLEAVTAGRGD